MSYFTGLKCLRCGRPYKEENFLMGCSACATERSRSNLTCEYDYGEIKKRFSPDAAARRPRTLWRWHELLPADPERAVTINEGDTALIRCDSLGSEWGLKELYVKDESRNPTWSYKDRLITVAISVAREQGARVITVSSTGNHGASAAAYSARAGLPCVLFTTGSVPLTMKTLMQSYGAYVVALPTLEDRWRIMAEAVKRFKWYPVSNGTYPPVGSTPYGIEGYKTIAYELSEAFKWQSPDRVVVPVAFGDGFYGIWKGFKELSQLGLLQGKPRMVAAEPLGPLEHALKHGLEEGEPVPLRKTVAFSIGTPLSTHQALAAIKESSGDAFTVSDEKIMWAQTQLARYEGIYAESSSACALAAVHLGLATGRIDPDERICVIITSSGLKDPASTAQRLGLVPESEPTLTKVLETLNQVYGFQAEKVS